MKEELIRNVLEVKRVSDSVMRLKLETEAVMFSVVSGYVPLVGREKRKKNSGVMPLKCWTLSGRKVDNETWW